MLETKLCLCEYYFPSVLIFLSERNDSYLIITSFKFKNLYH